MVNSEMHSAGAAARPENTLEIGRLDETRHRLGRGLAPGHATARGGASDGQTLATLGAPGVDDRAAAARFHADEKAVRAGAADLGSLVGAFHWIPLSPCSTLPEGPMPAYWVDGARRVWRGAVMRETQYYTKNPLSGQSLAPQDTGSRAS